MTKKSIAASKDVSGQFAPAKIGASKAAKFALVEGVALNAKSKAASAPAQWSGLKGDDYREAISEQFRHS
jgi:hypothetical protein